METASITIKANKHPLNSTTFSILLENFAGYKLTPFGGSQTK